MSTSRLLSVLSLTVVKLVVTPSLSLSGRDTVVPCGLQQTLIKRRSVLHLDMSCVFRVGLKLESRTQSVSTL